MTEDQLHEVEACMHWKERIERCEKNKNCFLCKVQYAVDKGYIPTIKRSEVERLRSDPRTTRSET